MYMIMEARETHSAGLGGEENCCRSLCWHIFRYFK